MLPVRRFDAILFDLNGTLAEGYDRFGPGEDYDAYPRDLDRDLDRWPFADREVLPLDFLEGGRDYIAQIYRDGYHAHWRTNPYAYAIESRTVSSEDVLKLRLAPGGGAAIRFEAQPR